MAVRIHDASHQIHHPNSFDMKLQQPWHERVVMLSIPQRALPIAHSGSNMEVCIPLQKVHFCWGIFSPPSFLERIDFLERRGAIENWEWQKRGWLQFQVKKTQNSEFWVKNKLIHVRKKRRCTKYLLFFRVLFANKDLPKLNKRTCQKNKNKPTSTFKGVPFMVPFNGCQFTIPYGLIGTPAWRCW